MATLNFKGKAFVQNHHLLVKHHQLVPCKEKSLTDKVSLHDNLIIHGDNLKALKALLPTYGGKIKCIYIDPPYNTGNEKWVYNDNVNSPMMQEWLGSVVDKDDLTRHDKWLCMMMARLKLLREFLCEDGAIFVSIDDNEVQHLRSLMDEVFGEDNLLAVFVRRRRLSTGMRENPVSPDHEYVIAFAKSVGCLELTGTSKRPEDYPLDDAKGRYRSTDLTVGMSRALRPNQYYAITDPSTGQQYWPADERVWRFEPSTMAREIEADNLIWPSSKAHSRMSRPRYKTRYDPEDGKTVPVSTWMRSSGEPSNVDDDGILLLSSGLNQEATRELRSLLGEQQLTYPKPVSLVRAFVSLFADGDAIILDSFAGSGTTAHAVLAMNQEDGEKRRFILIECEDYADSITAERVRRVIKGVPNAKDEKLKSGLGGSFSYFELGEPIEMESILSGDDLPTYKELARYVFYTATGEEFDESGVDEEKNFIGESKEYLVYLFYEPSLEYLKKTALTLDRAKGLGPYENKRRLVFAATKYLDQRHLDELRIDFAQLPFEIYQLVK